MNALDRVMFSMGNTGRLLTDVFCLRLINQPVTPFANHMCLNTDPDSQKNHDR